MNRGIDSCWIACVLFVVLRVSTVTSQLCDVKRAVSSVRLIPEPFGSATPVSPLTCTSESNEMFLCLQDTTLLDDNTGPQHPDLEVFSVREQFVAWGSDTVDPYLSFEMADPGLDISAIDLYVLNYPELNIGLPNLQLYRTSDATMTDPSVSGVMSVDFVLQNNDQLSQADTTVRRVTLRPQMPFSSQGVLIRWNYLDLYNVQWFLVSEVKFCGDTQPPYSPSEILLEFLSPAADEPVSVRPSASDLTSGSLTLTCTVSNQGSFVWRWRRGILETLNTTTMVILGADGTRTSKLIISDLNFRDAEEYVCEASFVDFLFFEARRHDLQFPLLLDVFPNVSGFIGVESVELDCEVHGYATFSNPPTWTDGDGSAITTDTSKYSVGLRDGSNTLIYSNGTTGPSIVSTLTISSLSFEDEDDYSCNVQTSLNPGPGGVMDSVMLTVVDGTPPVTQPRIPLTMTTTTSTSAATTNTASPPQISSDSSSIIVAAVVASLVTLVILTLVLMVFLLLLVGVRYKRQGQHQKSPAPPEPNTVIMTTGDEANYETIGERTVRRDEREISGGYEYAHDMLLVTDAEGYELVVGKDEVAVSKDAIKANVCYGIVQQQ